MRYQIWSILVFLWANLAAGAVFAQEGYVNPQQEKYLSEPIQARRFDENTWQKSIEGLDYSIKKKKAKIQTPPKKGFKFDWPQLGNGIVVLLKVLVVGFMVVILALLLQHYLNAPKNRAVKKAIVENLSIEEIEENLEETELFPYINKAIDQNDYAMAVRLYYLEVLKQLSAQRAITWRKNKTNRQYLQEMRSSKHHGEFRMLTLIFERVRYGGQQLDQAQFEQIEPGFQAFLKPTPGAISSSPPVNVAV
jgi:hypothetical protein